MKRFLKITVQEANGGIQLLRLTGSCFSKTSSRSALYFSGAWIETWHSTTWKGWVATVLRRGVEAVAASRIHCNFAIALTICH